MVNMRAIVLIAVAFGLAGGTAYFARSWLNAQRAAFVQQQQTAPEREAKRVLVAKQDLEVGQLLKPEDMRWQAWPDETLAPTYMVEGERKLEEFVGAVVRTGLAAGEPLTDRRMVKPGDRGFLAAVLEPGMRAISVSVNATTGISGFVFPGDRVDVLLSHSIKDEDAEGETVVRRATETVLTNVRIVAVDQRTDDTDPKATVAKTATLEVTPKQAEIVAVVSEIGKISLALRSLRVVEGNAIDPAAVGGAGRRPLRKEKAAVERTLTYDTEVSRLIRPTVGKGQERTVAVLRGPETETVTLK